MPLQKEHLTSLVITQLDLFSLRLKNLLITILKVEQIQALTQLVVKQIQLQRANRAGVEVPDEMLNRALSDIARRNGTTLSKLPELLEADGVSYSAYRNEMREQMKIEALRQRDLASRAQTGPHADLNFALLPPDMRIARRFGEAGGEFVGFFDPRFGE